MSARFRFPASVHSCLTLMSAGCWGQLASAGQAIYFSTFWASFLVVYKLADNHAHGMARDSIQAAVPPGTRTLIGPGLDAPGRMRVKTVTPCDFGRLHANLWIQCEALR
jgi:hypothetical protein